MVSANHMLFAINENILANKLCSTKKLILYGLYESGKMALAFLAQNDIYISGFLLDDSQLDLLGMNYLKKPLFDMQSIRELENEIIVLDVFGENVALLREKLACPVHTVFNLTMDIQKVILYGAGAKGKAELPFLQSRGFDVLGFCDRDSTRGGNEIISPAECKEKYADIPIIITVGMKNLSSVIYDMEHIIKPQNYRIANSDSFRTSGDAFYYKKNNDEKVIVAYAATVQYFITKMEKDIRRLILIGNDKQELKLTIKIFSMLDVDIQYAVSLDGFQGIIENTEVIHFYQIAYFEKDSLIYALRGTEYMVRELIERCGFSGRNFVYNAGGHNSFMEHVMLDPSLGYHAKSGNVVLHSKGKKKGKRIAVLGGSTSALYLYPETSWPEYLISYCEAKDIAVDCICGGVCGYKVSNELIKLVRDILPQKPDIVISYSGVNELWDKESYFLNDYQQSVFNIMSTAINKRAEGMLMDKNVVNYGGAYEDIGEHWLETERAMHGICSEFGIAFFSIMQPDFYDKVPLSHFDNAVKETLYKNAIDVERHKELVTIKQYVRQHPHSWIIDFTEVFNDYDKELFFDQWHLYSEGNRILAKKIFELIEEKLV